MRTHSALIIFLALSILLSAAPAPALAATAQGLQEDFIRVADQVMPSVVSLKAVKIVRLPSFGRDDFFRGTPYEKSQGRQVRQEGEGSGVIIDRRGYILTNNHVVGGAQQITVRLHDGGVITGQVVGSDRQFDIALVKVNTTSSLKPAVLGDSDSLRVGQWAIAIGSPFGLEETMTVGIISATGRKGVGKGTYGDFIQTDASINPGNSGGPLLDINGRVVGITRMMIAEAQGIGFAIPINRAKRIIQPWLR